MDRMDLGALWVARHLYYKASSVTSSHMVCDISTLHTGYISAADQLSAFVHTERLNKMK